MELEQTIFVTHFNNTKWNDMCGEKNTEKNWADITNASRSHIMSNEHTTSTVSHSHINTVWAMNNKWNDMCGKKNIERNSELELNYSTILLLII